MSAFTSSFPVDAVPQAPEDPLFGLMAAYRADTFDKKVDLGIGAYRDNDAKPWVLPVVKKVRVFRRLIYGLDLFVQCHLKVIFLSSHTDYYRCRPTRFCAMILY